MKHKLKHRHIALLSILFLFLFASCGSVSQLAQKTTAEPDKAAGQETAAEPDKATGQSSDSGMPSTLQVHYMDVGQGDATLLVCDGHAMLIDAGNNDKGTTVQSYLLSQNITSLDYVIGTHPDADHIGGLDVVITKFDCGTILLTDEEKDTNTYRDVVDAMNYRGYTKTVPIVGDTYVLGSARFTIVGPTELSGDSNGNSIAIILEHGENRFYFEGDAEETEEESILATGIDISANVYKAGHHGSKTSTSDNLLEAVAPQYAVISVGEGNTYGHPDAETLNKLRANGVQVFRTDEQGTIVATSDGNTVTWNCSSSDTWQSGEVSGSSVDSPESAAAETIQAETVHITNTGEKYHAAGCPYLKDSDIEIPLSEAKERGYTPCSRCNPPQ